MNPLLMIDQPLWRMNYDNPYLINNENNLSEKINIIFEYKEKKFNELCKYSEKASKAVKRFCDKIKIDPYYHIFIYSGKRLNLTLTVAQNGMSNTSRINIVEIKTKQNYDFDINEEIDEQYQSEDEDENAPKINVIFRTRFNQTNISANVNNSVETLIKNYLKRINKEELFGSERIAFIHNACKMDINNKMKIKDFFRNNIETILVMDYSGIIGA